MIGEAMGCFKIFSIVKQNSLSLLMKLKLSLDAIDSIDEMVKYKAND